MEKAQHQQYESAEGVHARNVNGEVVLLDLNSEQYFGLNEVGGQIWEQLIDGRTPVEVVRYLGARYEVAVEQLSHDVEELVIRLRNAGLLRPVESA